ncbi:hypothetical protein [Natronolimnohabitans innermongolicus]|uniref:Uncharacterized protein n=1 Tax=Natronolimnohabitans innermongolicus JCM 12255 TaxID=1227499 RepID=L9XAI7_9EURY|nr:hypothetical protein [Natronolimnohabitans innermongolicus]ELY57618.1 hypothetical protein C493_09051 [Natronolimnohabitans innermongolicus JCM 12255]
MSDESSNQTAPGAGESTDATDADADTGDSSGPSEPGGGPRRVVSEQSVDDILDSLGETKAAAEANADSGADDSQPRAQTRSRSNSETGADAESGAEPSADTDGVTTEFDERDVPSSDGLDDAETNADSDDGSDGVGVGGSDGDGGENSEGIRDGDTTPTIDDAASSLPDVDDDASLEDLAARVEDGAVTGADVRAAEAGTGRESTPEVDEIELSMDDLEATQSSSGPDGSTGVGDDAGPLAGSIGADADAGAGDDSDEDETDADSPGLLGRIKRFFGG